MIESPQQWHVYVVSLDNSKGSKPGKQRPCLAIQPSEFAAFGLDSTVILPITTKTLPPEAYPLRVRIKRGICLLEKDSDVMIDQILAWDNRYFTKDLGRLPDALQQQVKLALREFLDL